MKKPYKDLAIPMVPDVSGSVTDEDIRAGMKSLRDRRQPEMFLNMVANHAPEQEYRLLAYMCLTRFRALESGRVDPKHQQRVYRELLEHVEALKNAYNMATDVAVEAVIREEVSNKIIDESVARKMSWEDVCWHVEQATGKKVTHAQDALDGLSVLERMSVLAHMRTC